MTGGGPANATEVIATYTYKEAFTQNNVGYASTLSLVMTVISLIASVTFIRLRERQGGLTVAVILGAGETLAAATPMASRRSQPRPRLTGGVVTYAILIAFLLIFLLPFIWIWSSAFKTSQEIGRNPFALPIRAALGESGRGMDGRAFLASTC